MVSLLHASPFVVLGAIAVGWIARVVLVSIAARTGRKIEIDGGKISF